LHETKQKKHKKSTPPYWIFFILSSKELESSLSHKATLWRTMEKQIWRLGAVSLKMMSFQQRQISYNTWEKKLPWEILLLAFNYERPLVAHIINRFWKNTSKAPIRKQFHPYIPSEMAVNEKVTWRFQAFIA
jgi:hypothetical protein